MCRVGVGWKSFSIKCSFVWLYKQLCSPLGKTWRGLKKKKETWSSVKRESEFCLLNLSRASRLLFLLVIKMCSCEENPKKKKETPYILHWRAFCDYFYCWLNFLVVFFFACNPGTHSVGYRGRQLWSILWVEGSDWKFFKMSR